MEATGTAGNVTEVPLKTNGVWALAPNESAANMPKPRRDKGWSMRYECDRSGKVTCSQAFAFCALPEVASTLGGT